MTTIDTLPDSGADLDDLYARLHREGILDDPRKRQEPFKRFVEAYNSFQMNLKAAPEIIEQHRQAARTAAPAVVAALGDATAPAADDDTTQEDAAATAAPPNVSTISDASPETPAATEPTIPTHEDAAPVALAVVSDTVEVCTAEVVEDGADPASEINLLHLEIATAYGMSLKRAIQIGELLSRQKKDLGHGKFLAWMRDRLTFSERSARNYMNLFKRRAELESANVADLTTAYRLTAPKTQTKPKSTKKPKPSHDKGSKPTKPAHAQANATDTGHGAQQAHDDQSETRATAASSSSTGTSSSTTTASTGEKPSTAQADEQPEASTTSSGHPEGTSSSTAAATEAAAQEQQANQADAKATASETATTEAKPTAPKLTVEQLICMTVNRAAKKPNLAPDIIHRTAEAAGLDVLIVDAVTRDAVKELAHLLGNKIEDLAANDYEEACDLLTGIVEDCWQAVNAHRPDDGERDDEYE